MSSDGTADPPPYLIPGKTGSVRVYKVHTPFNPQDSTEQVTAVPVYTGGGGLGAAPEPKTKFVSYETDLGFSPGMTTCATCQQQVMTNVTYKAGTYAILMCLLFICCGLICCCCLIPILMNKFKDCYHTCPRCQRVLHVEKRRCCS